MVWEYAETTLERTRSSQSGALAGIEESCMRFCLQGAEATDLTLGKPGLFPLSTSATVAQALKALKCNRDVDSLSVWVDTSYPESELLTADQQDSGIWFKQGGGGRAKDRFRCGGMVTTADIVTFLSTEENLANPKSALELPISAVFPRLSQAVEHAHPHTSLCQTMEIMVKGVQRVVIPIPKRNKFKRSMKIPEPLAGTDVPAADFCWITQEDVVRYMLTCLPALNPLPAMSIDELGLVNTDVMTIDADAPASFAVPLIERASQTMTAVAIVSNECRDTDEPTGALNSDYGSDGLTLVGDLSTHSLRGCDETASAALATLSVRDFVQYVKSAGDPSQYLIDKIVNRMRSKSSWLKRSDSSDDESPCLSPSPPLSSTDESDYSSSSDDDQVIPFASSFFGLPSRSLMERKYQRSSSLDKSAGQLNTCRPQSTLVAVMAQALAMRANHVWVTEEDGTLVGIVTYADMIDVFLSQLHGTDRTRGPLSQ